MIDFKQKIAEMINEAVGADVQDLQAYIEVPKISTNGDYAFPCFKLAQTLKKAPQAIAQELSERIKVDGDAVEKIEIAGPYVNFYINKTTLAREILSKFENENFWTRPQIATVLDLSPNRFHRKKTKYCD